MNAPVKPETGSLWSLWDMMERYALYFSDMTRMLSRLERAWEWPPGTANAMTGPTNSHTPLEEVRLKQTMEGLEQLEKLCGLIGMPQVIPEIRRLYADLRMNFDHHLPTVAGV